MAEIYITGDDTNPVVPLHINGADRSKTVGTVFTPTAAELAALQQSHLADNIVETLIANLTVPTITGTAQDGQTLTAHNGTWNNAVIEYTYQWKADAVAIGGATAATYLITTNKVGAVITVDVTARNLTGSTTATSAATAAVIA